MTQMNITDNLHREQQIEPVHEDEESPLKKCTTDAPQKPDSCYMTVQ
jgi:hypothetical protein